jgi:hypothetical protein
MDKNHGIEKRSPTEQGFTDLINQSENGSTRQSILDFEALLAQSEGATFGDSTNLPLTHRFSDGLYIREMVIPAGTVLTGKIHKHDHPNFLMSGEILVVTEDKGKQHLKGPLIIISPAGTKRIGFAITDVTWVTVHLNPTNTEDLEKLEKIVIAENFDKYNKFRESGKGLVGRFKKFLIKKILT